MSVNIVNLHTVTNIDKWLKQEENLYVGRPCRKVNPKIVNPERVKNFKWKNPFKIDDYHSQEKVINLFEEHVLVTRHLAETVGELKGKILGCWCAPSPCHAEILHRLAGNHPVYQNHPNLYTMSSEDAKNLQNMSSGESSAFRKLLIGNLGSNITAEDLKDLFGLNCEEKVKQLITIELSSGPEGRNMALVHLPEVLLKEGL